MSQHKSKRVSTNRVFRNDFYVKSRRILYQEQGCHFLGSHHHNKRNGRLLWCLAVCCCLVFYRTHCALSLSTPLVPAEEAFKELSLPQTSFLGSFLHWAVFSHSIFVMAQPQPYWTGGTTSPPSRRPQYQYFDNMPPPAPRPAQPTLIQRSQSAPSALYSPRSSSHSGRYAPSPSPSRNPLSEMSHNSESLGLFSFSSSQYAHSPAASGAAIDIKFIEMAVEKLPHDNDGNQLRAKVQVLVQKYIDATNRKLKADFDVSQRQFAIDQAETSLTLLKTELQTFDSDKRNADITTNAVRTQLLPIQQLLMTRFGAGGGVGVDAASVDLTAMSTTSYDLTAMSTTCDMSGVVEFDESVPVPFVSAPAAAPAPAPRGFAPVAASMPAPVPAPMPFVPAPVAAPMPAPAPVPAPSAEVNVMTASLATIRTVFGIPTQTELNRLRETDRLQKSDVVEMTRKLKDGGFRANPEYRASNGGTAPPIRITSKLEASD